VVELGLAAGAIGAIYGLGLAAPLPVWAGHPSMLFSGGAQPGPPLGWPGLLVIAAYSFLLVAPYRPYVLGLRAAATGRLPAGLVVALTALLALVGLSIYPRFGSDVFDYVGTERLWAVYHTNPLVVAANSYPSDWAYAFMAFKDRPPPYGPLWVLITWPLVGLAGDDPLGVVLAYKALSLACYVACCALIWASVERRQRVRSLMAFAWSPLVLLDVLGKVHNDALPALAVLLAVVLASRQRGAPGLMLGMAGALVKATALAVAPVLVLQQVRGRRWRSLALGTTLAGVLAVLAYLPFWSGAEVARAFVQQPGRLIWSPGSLLSVASGWLPGGPYETGVRCVLLLACLGGCLLVTRRARLDSLADTAATSGRVLLLGLLFVTTTFYAHYLVPVVALAAVSGSRRLEHLTMALSIGGMVAYGCDHLGAALGPGWPGSTAYQLVGSAITLGPAGLVCLCWVLGWLLSRRPAPLALPAAHRVRPGVASS
jgi:hypothetical protein